MLYPEKIDLNLDQHFMKDEKIISKIILKADLNSKDKVLEIGAGVGSLTIPLAKSSKKVYAVEIDEKMIPLLCQNIQDQKNVEVIIANVLHMEYPKFNKIVSNLPYSICEPLIWKLMQINFDSAVLTVPKKFYMVLKEKKTKISILANIFFTIKKLFDIKKEVFDPKPRVDSLVIKLVPKSENFLQKVFRQYDKKTKNAILNTMGKTKRQSKTIIKELGLGKLLNKRITNLSTLETRKLYSVLNEEKRNLC